MFSLILGSIFSFKKRHLYEEIRRIASAYYQKVILAF